MPPVHAMGFAPSLSQTGTLIRRMPALPLRRVTARPSHRFYCLAPSQAASDVKVGFIGLGVMGLPMAANLGKTFKHMVVWNRTDKSDVLQKALAETDASFTSVSEPADVVRQCDIVFSMLSTPEAVRSVFHEGSGSALNGVTDGKSIVDCSTLRIEDMEYTAAKVQEKGGRFLEAPVSGSKGPAEQGSLIFLCAGEKALYDHPVAQEALDLMGKRSFFLGDVGNGTKMKLVVNQLMGAMLAAFGESIVLSEALNLSVDDLLEIISLGAMSAPMFALKGPKMKHGVKGYDTNFPLEHAQKDIRFAQMLGDEKGVNMGVSSAANEWYKSAKGLGLGRDDFAAVIESIRASAGRS